MSLKIYAENFRSFPKIDWQIPDGLTLIDGENRDTGGSNMAGKTTLLDAWFWCRYGWLPKWRGPKGGQSDAVLRRKNNQVVGGTLVRVTEQIGSDLVEIERARPSRLAVRKNGLDLPGLDQKGLESLLGMTADRALVSVYFPQKRNRSFFWMSDNDRMDLMSVVSGLDRIAQALEDSKLRKKDAESNVERLRGAIDLYDAQIKDLPGQVEEADRRVLATRFDLDHAKVELHRAELRVDEYSYDAEVKAKEEIEPLIDPILQKVADLLAEIQGLESQQNIQKEALLSLPTIEPHYEAAIKTAESEVQKTNDLIRERNLLGDRAAQFLAVVPGTICNACGQNLPGEHSRIHQERNRVQAEMLQKRAAELPIGNLSEKVEAVRAAQESYHKRKAELDQEPNKIRAAISELKGQTAEKRSEERGLQREIQEIKDRVNAKWKEKLKELRDARDKYAGDIRHLTKVLELENERLDTFKKQHDKLKALITQAETDIQQAREELDLASDLVEVFGPKGYRAVCFDGLIEKIGDRAGYLLGIMTQGLYNTRLDQIGQDSKGNQKMILKPVILKNSSEVPLDDLSGGGEERVALAYDIAVAESAGENMPLFLDEVLSGLDAVGKAEAMALLEEVSKTRPVLVIDHSSEFKAMFSQVLKVIYEKEESRLEFAP